MTGNKNRKNVLITGAGAGIGREMARLFYGAGYDLIAVSLVPEELDSLRQELNNRGTHGVVHTLAMDLAGPGAAEAVVAWCDGSSLDVDVLVNNAGFGLMGEIVELPWDRLSQMLYLNMVTVTGLCRIYGNRMKSRGRGRILNVASTIAFQPLPFFAVYSATKAYVSSFTQSLAGELRPYGVSVSCLYPGTTRTAFLSTAGIPGSEKGGFMAAAIYSAAMNPVRVARAGFRGVIGKKGRIIPGLSNRFHYCAIHWIPNRLIIFMVRTVLQGMVRGRKA